MLKIGFRIIDNEETQLEQNSYLPIVLGEGLLEGREEGRNCLGR